MRVYGLLYFFVSQRLIKDRLSITKEYVDTLILAFSFFLSFLKNMTLLFKRKSGFIIFPAL